MELLCKINFPVLPIAKARPRHSRFGTVYTPKRTLDFEKDIGRMASAVYKGFPTRDPLKVELYFRFPIAKTTKKKRFPGDFHIYRPDQDNLIKSVLDPLNKLIWVDDSQICDLISYKRYSDDVGILLKAWKLCPGD